AIILTFLLPFLGSFLTWDETTNLAGEILPLMHSFNLTRITFPLPFFMFVVLGYGMIKVKIRHKMILFSFLLGINIFVYQFEWRNLLNNHFKLLEYQIPSYRQYYAKEQFND